MNDTVKYVLIGGAVIGGAVLVMRAVQPEQQQPGAIQSIASSASSIAGSLFGWLKSGKPTGETPASSGAADAISSARMSPAGLAGYDGGTVTAWSSIGDAAISDGAGYSRLSGRGLQPSAKLTKQQAAQVGIIPGTQFALR